MSLLDFLFPKHCINCRSIGSYLCSKCFTYVSFIETGICVVCQKAAFGSMTHPICQSKYTIDGVFSSVVFNGVVKKLVYNFKYKPFITDLKPIMVDFFYEGLIQKETFYPLLKQETVLVPVPLHSTRMKMRGYNQSLLLAHGIGKKLGIPVSDCLDRVKKTQTQVGLSQQKRAENMKDAFALKNKYLTEVSAYKQIFLIDDVATSGATLKESAKVFKKFGIKNVWGVTLAHGQ